LIFIVVAGFILSCDKKQPVEKKVLKVALAKLGSQTKQIWVNAATEFEKKFPNITIEYLGMDQEHYETSGLTSMLLYDNPDVYFEWGGERVETRKKDGNAVDLTEILKKDQWENSFSKVAWDGMKIDNRVFMVPYASQIASVFWFNKSLFEEMGLAPPDNWEQFENICEKLKTAGITPVYLGNKDLWPAGNVMGHLVSRVVGEVEYHNALKLKRKFNKPDFLEAFQYIQRFWEKGYINKDVNGLSSEEGATGWMNGQGAMFLLGSWVVDIVLDEAPENFNYDFFNLPAIKGKKGDQTSILGLNVGFIANAKTKNFNESIDFLRFITSPEMAEKFIEGGESLMLIDNVGKNMLPINYKLTQLLNSTTTIVSPPDTGYDLKTADEFYRAIAKVIGGVSTPKEALKELDSKLEL
jgi:raffinose/stachyose/melibiose transport system substrate-binding protein